MPGASPILNCFAFTPGLYIWVALQILVFYAAVIYSVTAAGAYLCWQADDEEA
jgi:hypothetical protein